MPAIRDFSQAYNTTTSLRHLEVPIPAYEQGDLLIAVMSADTGTTQAWTGLDPNTSAQYDDGGAFTNYTTESNNTTTADTFFIPVAPAVNDAFYVGGSTPFTAAWFQFSTQGAGTWTITWEYWNGGSWTALSGVSDGTTGFKAAVTIPVAVTYTMPTNWASTTVNSVSAYYIRGRVSAFTSITTRPVGTQVFLQSGWQQLFSSSNTSNLAVLYKTATASEVDTTFTYSIAETANGSIISVRDVDPWCDTKTYNAVQIDVVASSGTFTRTTGDFLTDGFTAGMAIKTTGFTNGGNNTYKIIQSVTSTVITVTDTSGLVNETGNGNERVTNWLFGNTTGFAVSTTSSAKANLPTMSTDVNNCLVMWGAANSTAGVPSIIEGACQLIFGKDGSAHSDACSWGWQATAGTTATVGYSTISAAATRLAVWAIRSKGVGTPVIPGYTASDSSVYVTPYTGAAYNGDSATTNTITTPFTGTINGKTLATGGTTVTTADYGLNSYHAMSRCSGIATAGSWAGTRTTIVARTTLASKNILFHVNPLVPVEIQTTDSVALTGTIGVAIGLASTTSNFKVWHVAGAGTSWGTQFHRPVVINTDATDGVIQTTGSLNTGSITEIGFMISGKNVSPDWNGGSVWAMDTCVISGGSSVEPLNIIGTVGAYATGHERRSAISQGTSQMLVLGPIQFGDGGTSPIYLGLDATAIEFPRKYNKAQKEVYYNSIDNFAGITYYPGASDVISHTNSVVSSPSRYKWGLHASASTSATYDFSGLSVIGAGTVTLNKAITVTGLTVNDYSTLDVSGLTYDYGYILNMPSTNDSVTTSSTTVISNTDITTTTVTAGNRWASVATADLDMFSGCNFIGSTTSGHAVRLTSTGTVSFSGNSFTGYGPAARSFNASTGVNTGTDVITLDAAHGYNNGEPAYFQDQGGTAPTGLTDGNLYYVRSESSTTITLYDTSDHAIAGGATGRADITATGSGTQYIYSAAAAIYNNSGGAVTINVTNGGSTPSIRNSDGSSTTVNNAVNLTITVLDKADNGPINLAQVAVYKTSDDSQIMNEDTETVTAGSFVTSVKYRIVSVGSTDFTAIGAASNTIGVIFTATGAGSGTGTATNGVAVESFNYITDTPIYIRVRKSSPGETKYVPTSTTGTITNAGFSVTISLDEDTNA